MAKVVIVGAGMMGTATTFPLADNGHSVHLVGTHLDTEIIQSCKTQQYHPKLKRAIPPGVRPYFIEEIADAVQGAEIIVSGVNSLGVHWMAKTIGPLLRPGQKIIAVTKGLEVDAQGNLVILPDVLASELPAEIRDQVELAAIGGPCIAGELAGRRQTCVVFGARDAEAVELLARAFRTGYYHVFTTTDLVGLEYCAALKNAYAMAVGIAYGILQKSGGVDAAGANGHNLAAAIFGQSCSEMGVLLNIAAATQGFALGLPGAGDLFVTTNGGRTSRLGQLIGAGHDLAEARQIMVNETLEAVEIIRAINSALPKLEREGRLAPDALPLMRTLIEVIVQGKPVDLTLESFGAGL
jgi:glycerol-3-phosphate dehydrogenase (NAD(P)+)